MKQYLGLLKDVLENGTRQANRTGIDAISLPGAMLKFNLKDGFPAVTTKKLAFKACKGELVGFLRGYSSAADFRSLGCNIWDQNANENAAWLTNPNRKGEDDLGRIYGVQWRDWKIEDTFVKTGDNQYEFIEGQSIDQVQRAIDTIKNDPTNRRIIVNAWRPDEFDQMALPPCHVLYQFIVNVEKNELNLCMYQRSCDLFLGVPFNIASASLFLSIMAKLTGLNPGTFTHFLADAHIYINHIDQVNEQLSREPLPLPKLVLSSRDWDLNTITPDDISLEGYQSHASIKAEMAV
jgi:thymidylate synthase